MVSGFFTSPYDQERILSGEASRMRMASKDMPSGCFSNTVVIPSNVLPPLDFRLVQFHIESKALEFLDQDIKGLRQPGLEKIFSLDDRLIHARTPGHIIR